MRIVITGGGSGGHIVPFIPVISELRKKWQVEGKKLPSSIEPEKLEIKWMGVVDDMVRKMIAPQGVEIVSVPSGKLRRYASWLNLLDMFVFLPIGLVKAWIVVGWFMPDVVISKGGFGSVPVVLAANWYRIPVLLHESDAVMGLANRKLAKRASLVALGFSEASDEVDDKKVKTVVTGIPTDNDLLRWTQDEGKKSLGLVVSDKVLLIIGGSQGSAEINEVVLKVLARLIVDFAVVHVVGEKNKLAVETVGREIIGENNRSNKYVVLGRVDKDFGKVLAAADAVVSRAGATTLAELAMLGKPCLLIPFVHTGQDNQRKNAAVFEAAGAARVLDPTNLGPSLFEQNVRDILEKETVAQGLATGIKQLARPKAATFIANAAWALAQGLKPEYE